jgi:linoleoyl-CoA desaturase
MSKVSFKSPSTPFFKTLKEKVDQYFVENQIHPTGGRKLYIKSVIQIISAIALYTWLVFFTPGIVLSVILCAIFGFSLAVIGFNVMHEGGHNSFSENKKLNKITAYSLNMLGGNTYFWKIKHNVNHHTFTNIEGHDGDIDVKPFMRLSEEQPKLWIHKFQHIYWVVLYGVSYFAWILFQDFQKYFTKKITKDSKVKMNLDRQEHMIFWATKVIYIGVYIVVPILVLGLAPALLGIAVAGVACGIALSIVFQLAHVVEHTVFPLPNEDTNKMDQEWAIHQLNTTANFSTRNKVISWFLGGLNFQIEHHLFPKISHIHYPVISQIVKETCADYNVGYIEYPSFFSAFKAHLFHIKKLGVA